MTQLKERSSTVEENTFLNDVLLGLSQSQKTLPSKYFYDDRGSQLFEDICRLDEYYLTRTEMSILEQHKHEIVGFINDNICLIEPGAGAGKKAAILLSALGESNTFIPLEISPEAIAMSHQYLSDRFPKLTIRAIQGDFTDNYDLQKAAQHIHSDFNRLVFFPGSTLGNFETNTAIKILRNLKTLMGKHGKIIIGLDLIKNERKLLAAYDDCKGVTANFNLNILDRINAELGANFDTDKGFSHKAVFNRVDSRIEMHLESNRVQSVHINEETFSFKAGETIHTENSHKYSLNSVASLCKKAGLSIQQHWTDHQKEFGVFELVGV